MYVAAPTCCRSASIFSMDSLCILMTSRELHKRTTRPCVSGAVLRSPQSIRTHPTLSPSMIAEVRLDATKRKVCVSAFRSQSGSKPEPTTVFMPSSRSRQSNTLRNRKYVLIEPSEHIRHNLQAHVPFQREERNEEGGAFSAYQAGCLRRLRLPRVHSEVWGASSIWRAWGQHALPHTSIDA